MSDFDPIFGSVKKPVKPQSVPRDQIAYATGNMPGYWTSDHLNEIRHFTDWNYVAIHANGKQFAQASISVYDNVRTKGFQSPDSPQLQRKHNPKHPISRLMNRPNPRTSKALWLYQLACQMGLTGGFAIWEVPSLIQGIPAQLWVIPRGWLWYWPPSPEYPEGVYRVTPVLAPSWGMYSNNFTSQFLVDAREMIIGGWSDPQYLGEYRSPLAACSQIIDICEQTDVAVLAYLKNNIKPGILFSVDPRAPMSENQIEMLIERLNTYKAGPNNAGKSLVAQGVTPQRLSEQQDDYTTRSDFNRKAVFQVQGTPPLAAGDASAAGSYSGAAVVIKTYTEMTIQPNLCLLADVLTHRWQERFGADFCLEINAKGYDDPTLELQRFDKVSAGVQSGIFTKNEARAALGYPPVDGGDELQDQSQQMGGGMPGMEGMMGEMGAGGSPQEGQEQAGNGDGMEDDPMAQFDSSDFDLDTEMGDDETTGEKNPLMQEAAGNRMKKAFSLNGYH